MGDDIEWAYAEAKCCGFEIVRPLSSEPWGDRAPDGNLFNVNGHKDAGS